MTALDRGEAFDLVCLDNAKTFDKVPHQNLLKLEAHGVTREVRRWVASLLTNSRQREVLNSKFSPWEEVLSGVSQGSMPRKIKIQRAKVQGDAPEYNNLTTSTR